MHACSIQFLDQSFCFRCPVNSMSKLGLSAPRYYAHPLDWSLCEVSLGDRTHYGEAAARQHANRFHESVRATALATVNPKDPNLDKAYQVQMLQGRLKLNHFSIRAKYILFKKNRPWHGRIAMLQHHIQTRLSRNRIKIKTNLRGRE